MDRGLGGLAVSLKLALDGACTLLFCTAALCSLRSLTFGLVHQRALLLSITAHRPIHKLEGINHKRSCGDSRTVKQQSRYP